MPRRSGKDSELRRFTCDDCGKAFKRRFTLQEHTKIHTGERPYACTEPGCTSKFSTSGNLSRHKKVHTNHRHHCTIDTCPMVFASNSALTKHMRTHSNETPYKCPMSGCHKIFTSAGNLSRHTKRHEKKREAAVAAAKKKKTNEARKRKAEQEVELLHQEIIQAPSPKRVKKRMRFPPIPQLRSLPNIEMYGNPTPPSYYTRSEPTVESLLATHRDEDCFSTVIIERESISSMYSAPAAPTLEKLLYCTEEDLSNTFSIAQHRHETTKVDDFDKVKAERFADSCFSFELDQKGPPMA